jgi:gluconate 2-dehydrogenase alpha chain
MFPSVTTNYADLDPHYTDLYGDPLIRQTMDVVANGTNCSNDQAAAYEAILTKMGATNVSLGAAATPLSSHITNWSAHTRGGARMGTSPSTSVFNAWGQHWTAVNLFAAGEITLPNGDNVTTGGTHPAGASALIVADGIKQYLKSPDALVTGSV